MIEEKKKKKLHVANKEKDSLKKDVHDEIISGNISFISPDYQK